MTVAMGASSVAANTISGNGSGETLAPHAAGAVS
jgi:hypothetical protein